MNQSGIKDLYPWPESISIEHDGYVIDLHESAVRDLASIAVRNNIGFGTAIVQAVANEKFLLGLEDQGWRLLIHEDAPDGPLRKLYRSPRKSL